MRQREQFPEQYHKNRRILYAQRKAAGLCTGSVACKNELKSGSTKCAEHSLASASRTRKYQKDRQQQGICVYGGCKAETGGPAYCKKHRKLTDKRTNIIEIRTKIEVMSHYCKGKPSCMCPGCTVSFLGFLQIDHVKGGGSKHRADNDGLRGTGMIFWLKKNNFPDGFQVLCANCNSPGGKGSSKKCPLHGKKHL
jgi:hypothetical protein